jgi:hypothetical protein
VLSSAEFDLFTATPQHSDPAVVVDHKDIDSDSDTSEDNGSDDALVQKYDPTVPRLESGLPGKSPTAPLDPGRPCKGMHSKTLEEAIHFGYKYEIMNGRSVKVNRVALVRHLPLINLLY